jgi:hypothetical protein
VHTQTSTHIPQSATVPLEAWTAAGLPWQAAGGGGRLAMPVCVHASHVQVAGLSGARLVYGVERGLGGAPEAGEPGLLGHLADGRLPGLGAEGIPAGLGAGVRHAQERGERVHEPAYRVEVAGECVAGQRLDDQPGAVGVERLPDVPGGADRVAHVVQAVEGRDEVVAVPGERLGGRGLEAGAAADAAVAATRGITVIELPCLAARAFVLSRLGRHDEALALAAEQLVMAERMASPAAAALARHDAGLISLEAGGYADAAQLLADALAGGAEVSRPAARLARAEALARSGRPDEAAAEVRRAVLEPVHSSDRPWALVPWMARVQGLIALARGDRVEARRRLNEAATGWRRHLERNSGADMLANFVDLGRPPIVGLVEPGWELQRLTAELAELDQFTEVS